MLQTYRAHSVPLMSRTRREMRQRVWSGFPGIQNTSTPGTDSAGGQLRTQQISSSAQASDLPHNWRVTKTYSGTVFARHSPELCFCDSKASLAKQRNSCYSGKRIWQNDSPATSVITTPPVTNKLFQSYYSILGTHCLYDILPDIIWDMGTHSV